MMLCSEVLLSYKGSEETQERPSKMSLARIVTLIQHSVCRQLIEIPEIPNNNMKEKLTAQIITIKRSNVIKYGHCTTK